MQQADIPLCFAPINGGVQTRTCYAPQYRDLSTHKFSLEDKIFMAKELTGESNLLEPTRFNVDGTSRKTCLGMEARYNVWKTNFAAWLQLYNDGALVYNNRGRPPALDEIALDNITKKINAGTETTKSVFAHELKTIVAGERKQTLIRKNKRLNPDALVTVSDSLVRKVKGKLDIRGRVPQDITTARLAALTDVRMAYRVACFYDAFSGHLPPCYKWNADATTAVVQEDRTGALVCFIPDGGKDKKLDSSVVPGSLNLLVKWMALVNAAGESGPLVLIITMSDMPDGAFFAHKVKGLSGSTEIGAAGWVYLCNSRAGNAALWHHWFQFIVIPTFEACREHHNILDSDNDSMNMFFTTDGEAVIMQEAFDAMVLAELRRVQTDMGKGGPGSTSRWQALDRGVIFRDYKCGLTYITKSGVDTGNETLARYLSEMWGVYSTQFPSLPPLTAAYKKKVVCACEKITYTMRAKYVTPEKISQSFIACGQHVKSVAPGQSNVSYDRIMGDSLAEGITDEEFAHMRTQRPLVIAKFKEEGRVLNTFLDELGIVASEGATDRDDLTLCRQDCQLITHADTVARFNTNRVVPLTLYAPPPPVTAEAAAAGAGIIGAAPDAAATTAAQKVLLAAQKKAAAKQTAAEKKAAEATRKADLSPAQRAAENMQKKLERAQKKIDKETAEVAAVEAAQALLGISGVPSIA